MILGQVARVQKVQTQIQVRLFWVRVQQRSVISSINFSLFDVVSFKIGPFKSSSAKRRKSAFVKVRDRSFKISLSNAHKPCKNKVFRNADKIELHKNYKKGEFYFII